MVTSTRHGHRSRYSKLYRTTVARYWSSLPYRFLSRFVEYWPPSPSPIECRLSSSGTLQTEEIQTKGAKWEPGNVYERTCRRGRALYGKAYLCVPLESSTTFVRLVFVESSCSATLRG